MGGADHGPLGSHFFDAPQQELAEAACLFDLSEHWFHHLLSQSVGRFEAAVVDLLSHPLGQRSADFSVRGGWVLGASGRDIAVDTVCFQQGKASCGVARQYTGSAGKITNCQIGVFAAYVSRHGHALIDRALYLPKEWSEDPDRLEAAYVPPDAGFATKPKLATRMIARAIATSVPFKWVAGDTVYGVGDIEQQLRGSSMRMSTSTPAKGVCWAARMAANP